jgi:iron(III) transport system substrate-binding protein
MKAQSLLFALALVFLACCRVASASTPEIIEGAKKERQLVVYTSMTVDQMQQILNAFKAKYPFIEPHMFRAVGERLLTKILTETQSGRYDFDVVQSAETQAYILQKSNLLARYASAEAKSLPKAFVDAQGHWAAVYIMPNVVGFNTKLVKRQDVPKNEQDLLDPKWKGKIAMDPTKPEWFAWVLKRMGREQGLAYMKRLAAQELRLHPGLSLLTNLLAAGEFPLALNTYLHNVEEVKKKGGPADWVAFDPVFTKFQPIEVSAKAPHPNAAKLFIDFVLSLEGQKIIASFSRVPTRPGVQTEIPGLDQLNFVVDDFNAAEDYNKNYDLFRSIFVARKQ